MTTGQQFTNIVQKKLMGTVSFRELFLDYLRALSEDSIERLYNEGSFNEAMQLDDDGANKVQILLKTGGVGDVHDGKGHILDLSLIDRSAQFENSNTVDYEVGAGFILKPVGIQLNSRTGYPEYQKWEEDIGEEDEPTSVSDGGTTITFNVNSICGSGVNCSGRTIRVFKNTPDQNALSESIAIEELIVSYSAPNNTVTTSGTLGQTTISTTPGDYKIQLVGISVKRETGNPISTGNFFFAGVVTGNGGTPSAFDISGQTILISYPDIADTHISKNELAKTAMSNWLNVWCELSGEELRGIAAGYKNETSGGDQEFFVAVGAYASTYAQVYGSRDGIYWVRASLATKTTYLNSVCFDININSGYWVAVGDNEGGDSYVVVCSYYDEPNDSNWSEVSMPVSVDLNRVTSNGTIFIAVGESGTIVTSSLPSSSWISRTSGTSAELRGIAWSPTLSLFCVVGGTSGPVILTSPDGIVWTSRTPASGLTENIIDVCWNGTVLCAIGNNDEIQTSSDGINWTQQVGVPADIGSMNAIASDNNGRIVILGEYAAYASFDNGVTWEKIRQGLEADTVGEWSINSYLRNNYPGSGGLCFGHNRWVWVGKPEDAIAAAIGVSMRYLY